MRHPRFIVGVCAFGAVLAIVAGVPFGAGSIAHASSPEAVIEPLNAGSRVAEFDSTGANPIDVVAGADGSVWVALFTSKKVVQLDKAGNPMRSVALAESPSSLATDGAGGVWATELSGNAIAHVTAAATPAEFLIPTPFSYPASVYDSGDLVFFAESTKHLGRLNELTGHIDELAFTGTTSPVVVTGIGNQVWVVDDRGDTWALDQNGENPVAVNLRGVKDLQLTGLDAGTVRGLTTTNEGVFEFSRSATDLQSARVVGDRTEITGVAALNGATWFADAGTNTIGWVTASEQAEYAVPKADSGLSGMTVTEGRYIWSAERWSGKVVRIDTQAPDVERVGGADRYELAANISKASDYSGGDNTVFVVSGETFADALSAGPIAAAHTAPVLLTARATLPGSTKSELMRLTPRRVIIVAGPASVS
ncbi:cell wall-binding repeat-containing protein [Herbiconiux sp. CPCC 205763]|uniref:Cell wall-binding repeat-containing protein n=1 Tax=Herbiconiux aconitum TaxID=2970913 RepID=A0ABT2GM79_9MICO|nr:cell wall-binding repeat-containing protein [Herbiconiux aconitum]MCS5717324.1 cell wall-binding repeat-containing protein [Herbiconiux aconitum]